MKIVNINNCIDEPIAYQIEDSCLIVDKDEARKILDYCKSKGVSMSQFPIGNSIQERSIKYLIGDIDITTMEDLTSLLVNILPGLKVTVEEEPIEVEVIEEIKDIEELNFDEYEENEEKIEEEVKNIIETPELNNQASNLIKLKDAMKEKDELIEVPNGMKDILELISKMDRKLDDNFEKCERSFIEKQSELVNRISTQIVRPESIETKLSDAELDLKVRVYYNLLPKLSGDALAKAFQKCVKQYSLEGNDIKLNVILDIIKQI